MQNKVTQLSTKESLYATLNTRLGALDTALKAIQDTDDFRSFSVTTEEDATYSVTATGEAIPGSYEITVNSLAKAQLDLFELDTGAGATSSFSSATTAIFASGESGTVDISLNGTTTNISVDDTTTLTQMASKINAIDGITAYVVQTATSEDIGADAFSLVVQADETGLDGGAQRIIYGDSLTDASSSVSNEVKQAGSNASVDVSGTTITSASNTITAIEGMTIVAEKESATAYTTALALDTSAMSDKVSAIVDAFNSVISLVATNSKITSSGTNQDSIGLGAFVGESTPRTILQRLRSILSEDYGTALSISGRTSGSQLGIKTNGSTGLLEFSSTDFIEALNESQSDVEALFSSSSGSLSDAMRDELKVYIQPSTGILAQVDKGIEGEIDAMEASIDAEERRIEKFKARLRKQFTGLETITSSFKTTSSFLTSFFAPAKSS
jgi:flagellar hook-associated protein 2